jgi:hypothetical protein
MAAGADEETSETSASGGRTPLTMVIPAAVLTAGGLIVTLGPGFGRAVVSAALRFQDQAGYNAGVLGGTSLRPGARLAADQVPGQAWPLSARLWPSLSVSRAGLGQGCWVLRVPPGARPRAAAE